MKKKKSFIGTALITSFSLCTIILLVAQSIIGGIISGIAAFFTKKKLEEWKKEDGKKS
jgi:hypothetical protein